MKKLSDNVQELADRAANAKNKVTAAEQESKEKLQASIPKSKADAKVRQEAFKAQVSAKQAASAQQWEDLQAHYNQKVASNQEQDRHR